MSVNTAHSSNTIPFFYTHPQQSLRLLELPPGLLELVTQSQEKNAEALYLKSPSANLANRRAEHKSAGATKDDVSEGYLNLCTETQTYAVRQVNSSNSVFLVWPETDARISAIAQSPATLELQLLSRVEDSRDMLLAKKDTKEDTRHIPAAVPYLLPLLEVFEGAESIGTEDAVFHVRRSSGPSHPSAKDLVFHDVPVSQGECEIAWNWLCAFEYAGQCYHPSVQSRLGLWKQLVEAAAIGDVDIEKQFLMRDLWREIEEENLEGGKELEKAAFEAVIMRLSPTGRETNLKRDGDWSSLDRATATAWVGETYILAKAPQPASAMRESDFLSAWKDMLPEKWREAAQMGILRESAYACTEAGRVYGIDQISSDASKPSLSSPQSSKGLSAPTTAGTRKWHEKFKHSRR